MSNHTRACAACGRTFTSVRSDATVCSPKCGYRLRKARRTGAIAPTQQTCLGCGADLSLRHGNARYCADCYKIREKQHKDNRARPRTCEHCGETFTSPTGRERYCGYRCSGLASRARQLANPAEKTCVACGKGFATASSRMVACSTACKMWAKNHPGVRRNTVIPCATCGAPAEGSRAGVKYCSAECAREPFNRLRRERRGTMTKPPKHTTCIACSEPIPSPRPGKKYCSTKCGQRYYVAPDRFMERFGRTCERCGTAIDDNERITKRFCTTSCQVMHNQDVRRMRRRGLPMERISRAEIFDRDGMLCHLCYLPITGKPTIDHIIPIAAPGSPGHVWENVAAAHRACNSSKRDRVRPEDWMLHEELKLRRPAEREQRAA